MWRRTLDDKNIYLDSCATFHQVFCCIVLENVSKVKEVLHVDCNTGTIYSDEKGWFNKLFHVWLAKNGIANLSSIPQLGRDGFHMTYDMQD